MEWDGELPRDRDHGTLLGGLAASLRNAKAETLEITIGSVRAKDVAPIKWLFRTALERHLDRTPGVGEPER